MYVGLLPLGTVAKLWSTSKRLSFKQCLICIGLSFKKYGFNKKLYFLVQIKHYFFKQFCLKIHIFSSNSLETVKIYHNLAMVT